MFTSHGKKKYWVEALRQNLPEQDNTNIEHQYETSVACCPTVFWEILVHCVRKVDVFSSCAQQDQIRNESEDAGCGGDNNAQEDAALLESPRQGHCTTSNHSIPRVENDH